MFGKAGSTAHRAGSGAVFVDAIVENRRRSAADPDRVLSVPLWAARDEVHTVDDHGMGRRIGQQPCKKNYIVEPRTTPGLHASLAPRVR